MRMTDYERNEKNKFLFPHISYRGEVQPQNLVFNANLQEFAQKVTYICNLETGGKITSVEAYQRIKVLWQQLRIAKKELHIGENPFQPPEKE